MNRSCCVLAVAFILFISQVSPGLRADTAASAGGIGRIDSVCRTGQADGADCSADAACIHLADLSDNMNSAGADCADCINNTGGIGCIDGTDTAGGTGPVDQAAWRFGSSGTEGLRTGVLLDFPLIRMFGIYNSYQSDAPVLPHFFIGYDDFDFQLSFIRTYDKNGWDDLPVYPAVSAAVFLSPVFGVYHPQMGVGVWFSSLPETPFAEEKAPYQSWFTRVSLLRFGFSFGSLLFDFSLFDFYYGSFIPVNPNPGFRVVGNTCLGINFGGLSLACKWRLP